MRQPSNAVALPPGGVFVLGPSPGWYAVELGKYATLQIYDPTTTTWRAAGSSNEGSYIENVWSDGINFRIANQTGCAIGAYITNAGSGYTSAPTVTASAGGSVWKAIVGGALNTSVVITNGGSGYTYPPTVWIDPPPSPGIQATGYATISAGVVTGVTIVDQGAGYVTPPAIRFINDQREVTESTWTTGYSAGITTGYGAAGYTALTGAGTITAVLLLDHGTTQTTMSSIPTLTFTGGGGSSAAATVAVNLAITGYGVTSGGAGYPASSFVQVSAFDVYNPTGAIYANPSLYYNLMYPRQAVIRAPTTGGNAVTTGGVVIDGGCYNALAPVLFIDTIAVVTTAAALTITMGGVNTVAYVMPY